MTHLDEIIAFRRRIGLIDGRLRTLLELHEACRRVCNAALTAYEHRHRRTRLEPLPIFAMHEQIETEPSATEAVLTVLGASPDGATVDVLITQVKLLLPHATAGSVRTAVSRLASKGAIWGRRGKGAVYRLAEDAVTEAGYTRRRRRPPVSERIDPDEIASRADFDEAAALLLVQHGPLIGPDLLAKLKDKLRPRGKDGLKYTETNLGKDPGIVSTPFGYWLAGLTLPEKEEALRAARARGSRAKSPPQPRKAKEGASAASKPSSAASG